MNEPSAWHQEEARIKKDLEALGDPSLRSICRRCGSTKAKADMTIYDVAYSPWYLCNICNEDADGYQER